MKFRASVEATFGFPTYESGFLGPKKSAEGSCISESVPVIAVILLGDLLYRASA